MNARNEKLIAEVEAALEAGFLSQAAKKRANDALGRVFDSIRRDVADAILADRETARAAGNEAEVERLHALYWAVPMYLHETKEKHFAALAAYPLFAEARDLIAFRAAVKEAEIVSKPVDVQAEKVEAVRRSIVEEMEARKVNYIHGLDLSRRFGMRVSVNAHYVTNHKGTTFVRYFFFLNGHFTALNTIIAIAQKLEDEKKGL